MTAADTPDINERLAQAARDYAEMDPVDRALLDDEQRRSFVRGQIGRDPGPSILAEEVRRLRAAQSPQARRGVYVASRASIPERGQMWRDLRTSGVPVNSTWIDETGPKDTRALDELWVRIRREVTSAERLILYAEPDDFPLKGAFVEIGMALAANVPIFVVAPTVEIEGRNCRPFGSWIKHPLVSFAPTVEAALTLPSPQARDEGGARPNKKDAALREAERFLAYFAGETDRTFVGPGTPKTALEQVRSALGPPRLDEVSEPLKRSATEALLINVAQLLDGWRQTSDSGEWTEWDQSVRDEISAWLIVNAAEGYIDPDSGQYVGPVKRNPHYDGPD